MVSIWVLILFIILQSLYIHRDYWRMVWNYIRIKFPRKIRYIRKDVR